MVNPSAIKVLKSLQFREGALGPLLRASARDKGYKVEALKSLNPTAYAALFSRFVTRSRAKSLHEQLVARKVAIGTLLYEEQQQIIGYNNIEEYVASAAQNYAVDSSIKNSGDATNNSLRAKTGVGAATAFAKIDYRGLDGIVSNVKHTPITILGAGVSSLMVTRGLLDMGWSPSAITVIDRHGGYGGIWNFDHVAGLSRNNPKDLSYLGNELPKAPGSGEEIANFVFDLQSYTAGIPVPIKGKVTRITPGDLHTTVHYVRGKHEEDITSPIVINAVGLGKPKEINRPGWMTTSAAHGGPRWQQNLSGQENKLNGKRLTFIGLGNSTAEMLVQLESYRSRGVDVDYRVVTHYPQLSVLFPEDEYVEADGRSYQVFRDTETPNLVDCAGDLSEIRSVYETARKDGKLISDVTHWDYKDKTFNAVKRDGSAQEWKTDSVSTLIGYGHSSETLDSFGILERETGGASFDYDGEFHASPDQNGRKRVHPGYFGIGPLLESPENPNAIVIPGNIFRMGDLLHGITLRALEYQTR